MHSQSKKKTCHLNLAPKTYLLLNCIEIPVTEVNNLLPYPRTSVIIRKTKQELSSYFPDNLVFTTTTNLS